ncbi:hypothetical protein ANCCAN_28173 [Ancylostoma caninum]|uniref:Uncharacterized protein n=1 Tax=Ancylostoma caninum TaxID=29170 RepID=A0A368F7E2_ANCCA|nr:hypothetical protein ANCCAN_28173 [Ancylostoma caninum]
MEIGKFSIIPKVKRFESIKIIIQGEGFWIRFDRWQVATSAYQRRQQISKSIFISKKFQLAVRGKNKKEVVESLWKRFTQSADEVLLSGQRDVDDFFEHERNYLVEYNTHIKDAASKAEKVVKLRKSEFLQKAGFCYSFAHC